MDTKDIYTESVEEPKFEHETIQLPPHVRQMRNALR